ncbi:MAG: response regulator [Desulfarculus sp.]|nr:response regulator [Desulfarculus sp.]
MAAGLDVVVLDDDPDVCDVLGHMVRSFYTQGQVHTFSDFLEARTFCFKRGPSVAIFLLDAFLGQYTAFDFIEAITVHYPMAAEDTVVITGRASDQVVERCLALGVNHLLEKPILPYALKLAIRSIAGKYLRFAPRLNQDEAFARQVGLLGGDIKP